jgi:BirA family biotin operon repressor/biotin-[acetyl-CoA-carboxylase] ligase
MYAIEEFQHGLTTKVFGRKLLVFDTIDSTNACAKTLASKGAEEGTVVIADHQTSGRGRLGRIWFAEPENSLLFTVIIRPTFSAEKVGLLPFFAAVGIALAVETVTGLKCVCKWPNDILFHNKKSCGILLESTFQNNKLDHALIGIGLNVNQTYFLGDLEETATSLRKECGKELDRRIVFRQIMSTLESLYTDVSRGNFDTVLTEWKARAAIFGKQIKLAQTANIIEGVAITLADDGGLIVKTESGLRVFHAGDVTMIH